MYYILGEAFNIVKLWSPLKKLEKLEQLSDVPKKKKISKTTRKCIDEQNCRNFVMLYQTGTCGDALTAGRCMAYAPLLIRDY